MRRWILFLFLLQIVSFQVNAQNPVARDTGSSGGKHLRISLLICTEGNLSWESFGHSTIRVTDSAKTGKERDRIYNFGTFDEFDGSIASKFLRGKMQAFLESAPYDIYVKSYADEGRGITEREFLLNDLQKDSIINFLEENKRVENRYYNYDLGYDNCTTRIRDMFRKLFGSRLVYGRVIPPDNTYTFRVVCDEYCAYKPSLKLAMEIFFANTDKPLTNEEAMFVPSYLDKGMGAATLDGQRLCSDRILILQNKLDAPSRINYAFVITLILSAVTIICLFVQQLRTAGKALSAVIMLGTGVLGLCILYAWLFSGHFACWNNFNILWALPLNILFPFLGRKIKGWYGIMGIVLLAAALTVHFLKIQVMPIFELAPLFCALFCIFYMSYKEMKTSF